MICKNPVKELPWRRERRRCNTSLLLSVEAE